MQIIKEFRPANKKDGTKAIAVIRTNTYISTLQHFEELATIAREIVPKLKTEDIRVKCLGLNLMLMIGYFLLFNMGIEIFPN